ncbi:MAG: DsbA family protein [Patescibacteria group bacterium]
MEQDFLAGLPRQPWYKRVWFISLLVLAGLWFGIPLVLQIISGNNTKTGLSSRITAIPGATSKDSGTPVNVVTTDNPAWGFKDAPVTIVEFADFQCPFCREAAPILRTLRTKYADGVRFIYRDFPIADVHPEAIAAAEAARCANQQGKFWEYHDQLFEQQDNLGATLYTSLAQSLKLDMDKFKSCLNGHLTLAGIKKDYEAGLAAGVIGTPTFFVNGYPVSGALPLAVWDQIITAALKDKFKK